MKRTLLSNSFHFLAYPLLLWVLAGLPVFSQINASETNSALVNLFWCSGQVTTVDLDRACVVLERSLDCGPGDKSNDGCAVISPILSPNKKEVLAIVPVATSADDGQQQHCRLMRYLLPTFNTVGAVEIPVAIPVGAQIHLDGSQMILAHENIALRAWTFKDSELVPVVKVPVLAPPVDLESILNTPGGLLLRQFARTNADGRMELAVVPRLVASRCGNQLFEMGDPTVSGANMVIVQGSPSSLVAISNTPYAWFDCLHLSANGGNVLVEECKPHDSNQPPVKTGRLTVFDASSGRLIHDVHLPQFNSKQTKFVALGDDGSQALIRQSNTLFVVNFKNSVVKKIQKQSHEFDEDPIAYIFISPGQYIFHGK